MASHEKKNVDYFPFLCKEGKAMFYIEQKYGNDGYATWIKLLRQLAITDNHWVNLSDTTELMFLSSKCKISEEVLTNIITDLSKMGEFNHILWSENKILYSEKFILNIQDAYSRRNNKCMQLKDLCIHLLNLGIHNTLNKPHDVVQNPYIIEYNSISENNIINNNNLADTKMSADPNPVNADSTKKETASTDSVKAKKEKTTTAPTPFPGCMAEYNNFILENLGVPAKIDGQEGKALKTIITYLTQISTNKEPDGIVNAFKFILVNKAKWDPFHQNQLKISQINSNLTNIINSIKNGTATKQPANSYVNKYRTPAN